MRWCCGASGNEPNIAGRGSTTSRDQRPGACRMPGGTTGHGLTNESGREMLSDVADFSHCVRPPNDQPAQIGNFSSRSSPGLTKVRSSISSSLRSLRLDELCDKYTRNSYACFAALPPGRRRGPLYTALPLMRSPKCDCPVCPAPSVGRWAGVGWTLIGVVPRKRCTNALRKS